MAKGIAKGFVCAAVCSAMALGALPAAAQPKKDEARNYEYRFDDDPLHADGASAAAPRIVVVKTGRRDRLLRPRLHFVPEMLKSVESM
jgi:hypothetical protein